MIREKYKIVSEWEQINHKLQAVYDQEKETSGYHQSILGRLVVGLLFLIGLVFLFPYSLPSQSEPVDWGASVTEEEILNEPILEGPGRQLAETNDVELALRQSYRAKKAEYAFTWDVAGYEALNARLSTTWDVSKPGTSLDEIVIQYGKPNLLEYVDGWIYATYTKTFVEHLSDMGRYDERIDLTFKEEDGVWLLQDKSMTYLVSDDIKNLVESAPYRSTMIEGTNQKAWLKDLVAPLAVGQVSTGQGGDRLEEALTLLGPPTGYGFWKTSDTLVLIYKDADNVYLWFKRQENGDYLLAKRE